MMMKLQSALLALSLIAPPFMAQPQQQAINVDANLKTGPEVGQKVPAFSAVDQTGRMRNLDSLKGPRGLVLFFNRSVDW